MAGARSKTEPQVNSETKFDFGIPKIDFDAATMETAYDLLGDPTNALAKITARRLNELDTEYQGQVTYADLTSGRSPLLNIVPLKEEQRGLGLTDTQILKFFTTLKDSDAEGVPTPEGLFASGVIESLAGIGMGYKTAQVTTKAIPLAFKRAIPAPLQMAIAGGSYLAGTIGGTYGADKITDQIFNQLDPEIAMLPEVEASLKRWETTGNITPFLLQPWLMPVQTFTTAAAVRNLPKKSFIGPITKKDSENPFIDKFLKGKNLTPTKITEWAENALVSGGKSFAELSAKKKAGVIAAESTAIPATAAIQTAVQDIYGPRSEVANISAEMIGGLAPQVSFVRHAFQAFPAITKYVKKTYENKFSSNPTKNIGKFDFFRSQNKLEDKVIQQVLEHFENMGEDPNVALKQLEDLFLDSKGNIKPDYISTENNPNKVFSSQFVDSPAISSLDNTVQSRMSDSGALRDNSYSKSMNMQKALIFKLRSTGDPDLVKAAQIVQNGRLEALLNTRHNNAVDKVLKAIQKIYPEGGPEAKRLIGEKLAQVFKGQNTLFRNLEKDAWSKINTKAISDTFNRYDADGEIIETLNIPNVVEEWDSIVEKIGDSSIQFDELMDNSSFKKVNKQIQIYKKQLGLEGADPFEPPEISVFTKSFNREQNSPAGNLFNKLNLDRLNKVKQSSTEFDGLSETEALKSIVDSPSETNIAFLQETADTLRKNKDTASKNAAKLFDLKADEILDFYDTTTLPAEEIGPLTANTLIRLRSSLGQMARDFGGVGGNTTFNSYSNALRNAVLDDLSSFEEIGVDYKDAISLSTSYNNFVKRSFGQDIVQKNSRGKDVINDDLIVTKLFSGTNDTQELRVRELKNLGFNLRKEALERGYPEEFLTSVDTEISDQNALLSDALKIMIQDTTLSPEAKIGLDQVQILQRQNQLLQDYASKNNNLLTLFPALKREIESAKDTGVFLNKMQKTEKKLREKANNVAALKSVTTESPTQIIIDVYNSKNPSKDLRLLLDGIKKMPTREVVEKTFKELGKEPPKVVYTEKEALDGLKRTVLDYAFQKAGFHGDEGLMNASSLYKTLFQKLPNSNNENQTLGAFLEASKAMSEVEIKSMKSALERIISIQTQSATQGADLGGLDVPAIYDLYTRIAGAKIGTTIGGMMPGGRPAGLIEGQAGSKYLTSLTQEIPFLQEVDILEKIMTTPELLIQALKTPKTFDEKNSIFKRIIKGAIEKLDFVGGKGATNLLKQTSKVPVLATEEFTQEKSEQLPEIPVKTKPSVAVEPPRKGYRPGPQSDASPAMNAVRGGPQPVAQATPPAPPPAQADPQTRQKYAALFPNDPTSAMIKGSQGGIGSLFG